MGEKMTSISLYEEKMDGQPPPEVAVAAEKGGMKTMAFIIVNESFEKVSTYGLLANIILYLTRDYNMPVAKGANVVFIWAAATNFIPILGAFLADSYLGRFKVISIGAFTSFFGMSVLWLTALFQEARPAKCNPSFATCEPPSTLQLTFLFSAFALMSLGAGGIRPCSMAFGADQLDHPDKEKKARIIESYFNWYYASVGVSLLLSVTVIVYIQDHEGWKIGFGVPAVLLLISSNLFLLGSPLYVKVKAEKSLFTSFGQVVVAACKNRGSLDQTGGGYLHKGSQRTSPTERIRFLNKACLIRNTTTELNPDGSAANPWALCTVDQVEDLKSLIKLIPIWSTGIVIGVTINQHSIQVLQASTMDRHFGSNFEAPAGSFTVYGIFAMTVWVIVYDRMFVPLLRNYTCLKDGLTLKQRMGIGLLLSCAGTATAAVVESFRRQTAIEEGLSEKWHTAVSMSALWLIPQYLFLGLAEGFNAIAQLNFYYSELPKTMSSIGVALFTMGMGVGNLMGSVIVRVVDEISGSGGKDSWLSNNLNKGHYDYYYWVLTFLGVINFIYYAMCSRAYGPCKGDHVVKVSSEGEESEESELE